MTTTVTVSDHWISTARGKLFARVWTPSDAHAVLKERPTVLLFHDSLGCVDLWRDFPEQLASATRRRVVAYDRLGFGRSDPSAATLPLTFIRDEAVTMVPWLREALGLGAFIPFGHSVGGAMAIAAAATWREHCAAVITESAQTFVEDTTVAGLRAARVAFQRPGQVERLERYHGAKARWVLDAWIDTWLGPAFGGWCLDDELRAVRCPTLALHGDQDEYGSQQHLERITRLTHGASRGVILEGCGHVPHREQPGRVLDAVRQFLAPLP